MPHTSDISSNPNKFYALLAVDGDGPLFRTPNIYSRNNRPLPEGSKVVTSLLVEVAEQEAKSPEGQQSSTSSEHLVKLEMLEAQNMLITNPIHLNLAFQIANKYGVAIISGSQRNMNYAGKASQTRQDFYRACDSVFGKTREFFTNDEDLAIAKLAKKKIDAQQYSSTDLDKTSILVSAQERCSYYKDIPLQKQYLIDDDGRHLRSPQNGYKPKLESTGRVYIHALRKVDATPYEDNKYLIETLLRTVPLFVILAELQAVDTDTAEIAQTKNEMIGFVNEYCRNFPADVDVWQKDIPPQQVFEALEKVPQRNLSTVFPDFYESNFLEQLLIASESLIDAVFSDIDENKEQGLNMKEEILKVFLLNHIPNKYHEIFARLYDEKVFSKVLAVIAQSKSEDAKDKLDLLFKFCPLSVINERLNAGGVSPEQQKEIREHQQKNFLRIDKAQQQLFVARLEKINTVYHDLDRLMEIIFSNKSYNEIIEESEISKEAKEILENYKKNNWSKVVSWEQKSKVYKIFTIFNDLLDVDSEATLDSELLKSLLQTYPKNSIYSLIKHHFSVDRANLVCSQVDSEFKKLSQRQINIIFQRMPIGVLFEELTTTSTVADESNKIIENLFKAYPQETLNFEIEQYTQGNHEVKDSILQKINSYRLDHEDEILISQKAVSSNNYLIALEESLYCEDRSLYSTDSRKKNLVSAIETEDLRLTTTLQCSSLVTVYNSIGKQIDILSDKQRELISRSSGNDRRSATKKEEDQKKLTTVTSAIEKFTHLQRNVKHVINEISAGMPRSERQPAMIRIREEYQLTARALVTDLEQFKDENIFIRGLKWFVRVVDNAFKVLTNAAPNTTDAIKGSLDKTTPLLRNAIKETTKASHLDLAPKLSSFIQLRHQEGAGVNNGVSRSSTDNGITIRL